MPASIITVGNTKGGVGKTTIATHLACMLAKDNKVLLIDADTQKSASDFYTIRSQNEDVPQITCVSITTPTIHKAVKDFDNYDVIIIDAGGRDSKVFRSAILACYHFIIPTMPSQYDLWATQVTLEALDEARSLKDDIQAYFLLNRVGPGTNIAGDAKKVLKGKCSKYEVKLLKSILHNRVLFNSVVGSGLLVTEEQPKSKASLEIQAVLKELLK